MQATAYLELKLAWELFKQAPESLEAPHRSKLGKIAARQLDIERCILQSPAAAKVVIPKGTLDSRFSEILSRYESEDELCHELAIRGLNLSTLVDAIERDLKVEAILEQVAAATPPATEIDAEIYYRLHPAAFDRPEARKLRHILITFDGHAEEARARAILEEIRALWPDSDEFGKAALRHSQCPTAMEGGKLGTVKRGQLYPDLEPAAFSLAACEVSAVLQSPVGLHLVYCEEILPSGMLPFAVVCDRIVEKLTDKRRQDAQSAWIKVLLQNDLRK